MSHLNQLKRTSGERVQHPRFQLSRFDKRSSHEIFEMLSIIHGGVYFLEVSIASSVLRVFLGVGIVASLAIGFTRRPGEPATAPGVPQKAVTGEQITRDMGTGFNLGNTFDLKIRSTDPKEIEKVLRLYKGAGMKHVRIPITWMDGFDGDHLADNAGNIKSSHPRLKQLDVVIDTALGMGYIVVINTHHEHWLKATYDGSAKFNKPFETLWKQIAGRYASKSPNLIFEVLNEPEGAMGDWSGSVKPFDPKAIQFTRQINEVGYKAIRSTGGANATRVIMVSPNGQGNHSMLDEVYPTPDTLPGGGKDKHLIATVHTYDPWNFCGQDGKMEAKPTMESVTQTINNTATHAAKLGVAVNYGEYGVGRRERVEERNTQAVRDYYRTVRQATLANKMSNTPWDDAGWFGLVARSEDGSYRFVFDIVPYMIK